MRDGALPPPVRLYWQARTRIAAEVASALSHLYDICWSHGRLQPSTILLGEGLTARLGDTHLLFLVSAVRCPSHMCCML